MGWSSRRSALKRSAKCLWTLLAGLWPVGCTMDLQLIQDPPDAVAVTTTGPWASMIYVARTDSGVIAIDLGWTGYERLMPSALEGINAEPADVRFVFLTHGHRDHIAAWPLVRQATFLVGAGEVPMLTSDSGYSGWATRLCDEIKDYPRPGPGELHVTGMSSDTSIVLGRDTLYAFSIPGHTPGSMAYLFRGILFGGDAINWRPGSGFQGARPEFSDSVEQSRESLRSLWQRLPGERVRIMCSAHGKCAISDSVLRRRVVR